MNDGPFRNIVTNVEELTKLFGSPNQLVDHSYEKRMY